MKSSSSPSRSALIHVRSPSVPVVFELYDTNRNLIDSGTGELRRRVRPGLYVVEMTAGSNRKSQFVSVRGSETYEDLEIDLAFPTPTPMEGTSGERKAHGNAARKLSHDPRVSLGEGGRLMVFARNMEPDDDHPVDWHGLEILDQEFAPVTLIETVAARGDGWSGCCLDVSPGGYILRWPRRPASERTGGREGYRIDQSLWVAHGWTTMVFLATEPEDGHWLWRQGATIHMARLDEGFKPLNNTDRPTGMALEVALHGLRQGQTWLPQRYLDLVLDGNYENPMLGIVSAHALLKRRDPPWFYFDKVVRNLDHKVLQDPHPDVDALRLLGKLRREEASGTRVQPFRWPPMFYEAYRGLIERTWQDKEDMLVAEGSAADFAAATLLPESPWTCWRPQDVSAETLQAPAPAVDDELHEKLRAILEQGLEEDAVDPARDLIFDTSDAATKTFVEAVDRIREAGGDRTDLSLHDLTRQVGLPSSSLRRVFRSARRSS